MNESEGSPLAVLFDEDLRPTDATIDGEHLVVTLEGFSSSEQIKVRLAIVDYLRAA